MVEDGIKRTLENAKALACDQVLQPWPEKICSETQWIDTDAKTLLESDVNEGIDLKMTPQELYNSWLKYQNACALEVFWGHLYQERQTRNGELNRQMERKNMPLSLLLTIMIDIKAKSM